MMKLIFDNIGVNNINFIFLGFKNYKGFDYCIKDYDFLYKILINYI